MFLWTILRCGYSVFACLLLCMFLVIKYRNTLYWPRGVSIFSESVIFVCFLSFCALSENDITCALLNVLLIYSQSSHTELFII